MKKPAYRSPGQWSRWVSSILRSYSVDPEAGHRAEDDALWEFVHYRASEGDSAAKRLTRLARTPRTRWHA